MGNIFLVTGITGTNIKASLDKFVGYCKAQGKSITWRSIDKEVIKCGDKVARSIYPGVYEPSYRVPMLPREYLRTIWSESLQKIMEETDKIIKKGDLILTFHCCYYNLQTREYVSIVDYSQIAKLGAKCLITFMDDIYDSQNRLIKSQFFDKPESLEDSLFQLLRILDWRMTEIVVSGHCAHSCCGKKKHYLLATKHPLKTMFDLLYSEKPIAYFSHPITGPREMMIRGGQNLSEAERTIAECQELINYIGSDFIVFEPATIDELRLYPATGKLMKRWSGGTRQESELLWTKPESIDDGGFNFPPGWEEDNRNLIEKGGNSPLLNHFIDQVTCQINARDHKLVEQSDIVIAFRPFYFGKMASGVKEELKHLERLIKLDLKTLKGKHYAMLCCPSGDFDLIPQYWFLNDMIPHYKKLGEISSDEKEWAKFEEGRKQGSLSIGNLLAVQDCGELGKNIREWLLSNDLHLEPTSSGALGKDRAAKEQELATKIAQELLNKKNEKPYILQLEEDYGFLIVENKDKLTKEVRKFVVGKKMKPSS